MKTDDDDENDDDDDNDNKDDDDDDDDNNNNDDDDDNDNNEDEDEDKLGLPSRVSVSLPRVPANVPASCRIDRQGYRTQRHIGFFETLWEVWVSLSDLWVRV